MYRLRSGERAYGQINSIKHSKIETRASMRDINGAPIQLPEAVITADNLLIAMKRIDRERDDLVLSHIALDVINLRIATDVKLSAHQFTLDQCRELSSELQRDGWRPQLPIYIRELKANGVERLKSRLSFTDAVVYQALINVMLPQLVKLPPLEGEQVSYTAPLKPEAHLISQLIKLKLPFSYHMRESYYPSWQLYNQLKRIGAPSQHEGARWSLKLDVSGFYDHINHHVLFEQLRALEVDEPLITALKAGFDMWQGDEQRALRGVGLPQAFQASAILSELYMRPIDELLSALNREGYRAARYVDDLCICTVSPERSLEGELGLRQGPLRQIAAVLRGLGLSLNPSKQEISRLPAWSSQLNAELTSEEELATEQVKQALKQAMSESGSQHEAAPQEVAASAPNRVTEAPEPPEEAPEEIPAQPNALIQLCLEQLKSPSLTATTRATLFQAGLELLLHKQRQLLTGLRSSPGYYHAGRARMIHQGKGTSDQTLKLLNTTISQLEQMIHTAEQELATQAESPHEERQEQSPIQPALKSLQSALKRLQDESGRSEALPYLRDPNLQVTQAPHAEEGAIEEALQDRSLRLSKLIKAARSYLYDPREGAEPPEGLEALLLQIAKADETYVIQVTRLLDRFEHHREHVERCLEIAEVYLKADTPRYSIYRHLAELKPWPESYPIQELMGALLKLEERAQRSPLGAIGLIELVIRQASPQDYAALITELIQRLKLSEEEAPQVWAHHSSLLKQFSEEES